MWLIIYDSVKLNELNNNIVKVENTEVNQFYVVDILQHQ